MRRWLSPVPYPFLDLLRLFSESGKYFMMPEINLKRRVNQVIEL
jgi:hypothetical protein